MPDGSWEIGHGVQARQEGSALVVLSTELALPWRPRSGAVPGTAVRWRDDWWEVVDHSRGATTGRWALEPWREGVAMRDSCSLDSQLLSTLAAGLQMEGRDRQRRTWMALAAPLLGLVPGELQQRWERRWGFPAQTAVLLSALLELVAGGVGIVQLVALRFSAEWFLPYGLHWLVILGPLLLPEAIVRLHYANAHGEPIGSFLVVIPLLPFTSARQPGPRRARSSGALGTVLSTAAITVAVFFAPRRHQEAWGRRIAVWPPLFTLLSAACEIVGGIVDISRDTREANALTLVSLVVLADGLVRLLLGVLTRGPVGSLFGLPFLRYYDGWTGV